MVVAGEDPISLFRSSVEKYLPGRTLEMEILVGISSSFFISDLTAPIALVIQGTSGIGKTTLIEAIKKLPTTLPRLNITPASILDGRKNADPDHMLLYQLENRVLTIKDLAPISKNQSFKALMADLTVLCDGFGMTRQTANGLIGFNRQMKFNIIAAIPSISMKMAAEMSTMGNRLVNLRLPDDERSFDEQVADLVNRHKRRAFTADLDIMRPMVRAFYENIKNSHPEPIEWKTKNDDSTVTNYIAKLAKLVANSRAPLEKSAGGYVGTPTPEAPGRVHNTFYDISRCVGLIREQNSLTFDELPVAVRIGLDTLPSYRSALVRHIIGNDGKLTTEKYCELTGLSRRPAYSRFEEMTMLGICNNTKEARATKPIDSITLADDYRWLLDKSIKSVA